MAKDKFEMFGIEKETYEKSKDILPTFDLGNLEIGAKVYFQCLSKEPKFIEHDNKFFDSKKKESEQNSKKMKTGTLTVVVEKIIQPDGTEVNMAEKFNLWLSSASLRMGLLKIFEENEDNLEGVKFKIVVGTAVYKNFGENRCYTATAL